ncbi:DUF6153 family protein [Streptomyces sp. NPDC017230]|uniref:DUF6153 family protein n=1 Tax=unclassified Streptomyces TaxID=2593676 RepID=UPI0037A6A931
MTSSTTSSGRPAGRVLVLLVMAVLSGVLGMHALGPGGAPPAHDGTGHTMVTARAQAGHHASAGCSHTAGGSGHLEHADATCAAAGIGSPYVPPALTAALADASTAHLPGESTSASWPESGRAPPDLSELQLLRI